MKNINRIEIEISVIGYSELIPNYIWKIGSSIILIMWIVYFFIY